MPNEERPEHEHEPDLIECDECGHLFTLRRGWRVIGPAEVAVLEAAAAINVRWLESYVNIIVPTQADPQAYAFAQAELARRKEGG